MWTGRCRCPHNVILKCADEKEPLSYTSEAIWKCQAGKCAYVAQLNYMERFCNSVAELRKDIGATEESDVTISGQLEDIRQQLEWIRQNVGAADDDESTIAIRLDDIREAIENQGGGSSEDGSPDDGSVDKLEEVVGLLDGIKGAVESAASDLIQTIETSTADIVHIL